MSSNFNLNKAEKENFEKACEYALFLLGLKLRTEGELREKFRLKKYQMDIIDAVMKRLLENRYLNDENFAEVYVENLKKYKNFGYFGIKKKLMEKRLPANIIEKTLGENLAEDEEEKIARRFLGKVNLPDKQKTAQRLKARGFRASVIFRIIF